jgi:hypothetical protein
MTTQTSQADKEKKTRREWVEQTKKKLDEWDDAIDQLEAKAAQMQLKAKSGVRAQIKATKQSLAEARSRWSTAADEAGDVWEAVSDEVGAAWEANKAAFERSLEEIRSALR